MIEKFIEQYYNYFIPYKTKSWCYEDGILLKATLDLYLATKNEKYKDFIISYLDKFIDDNGKALFIISSLSSISCFSLASLLISNSLVPS